MKRRGVFTLIEVVVALGILTLSLAGLLQILAASQNRLARAYEKWRETHILMQAAEYYLLQPGEDPGGIPYTYFPYADYEALCYYRDAENLPEEYVNIPNQLPLRTCVIELVRLRDRKTVETILVDRISYETTLEGE
ncbi:type II secretion system protein [uncultured Victivallis sp.]|uniref:type II secretion system protein n=1 Tax=uncultured Victivallis sp. TaxID=354118 RepID=UPI0025F53956|nr:type II secretion system protein [uncultured Victivallis sp.]